MNRYPVWLLILLLSMHFVQAQIPANEDFIQTELNALFVVDEATDTTRALYSISYLAETENPITWVFPIPPGASDIELLDPLLDDTVEVGNGTRPYLEKPGYVCDLSSTIYFGEGWTPFRLYVASEGNHAVAQVNIDELLEILSQTPSERQFAAFQLYAELGWTFAIFSFTSPVNSQEVDPIDFRTDVYTSPTVSMSFPGTEPILPLAFHAPETSTQFHEYTSEGAYTTTVLIAAQTPYASAQAFPVELNFDNLRGPNMIQNIHNLTSRPLEDPGEFLSYYGKLEKSTETGDTQRFIIESITNPETLDDFSQVPEFQMLMNEKPYLTRLRSMVNTESSVPEAVHFVPDNTLDHFRYNTIKLIDPAIYWGCTTESDVDLELEARLPHGRTYIPSLNALVAHPDGWQLSEIEGYQGKRFALAPQPVDAREIGRLERGEGEFPMLVLERIELRYEEGEIGYFLPDPAWEWFYRSDRGFSSVPVRNATSIYFPTGTADYLWNAPEDDEARFVTGYRAVMMGPPEDWVGNEQMYMDMLAYLRTYPYFTSPELRHTLMLGDIGDVVAIGYPEDWHTIQDEELGRLILPESDDPPYVRVHNQVSRGDVQDIVDALSSIYEIEADKLRDNEPYHFANGFAIVHRGLHMDMIEISAPTERYEEFASLLEHMAESIIYFSEQSD